MNNKNIQEKSKDPPVDKTKLKKYQVPNAQSKNILKKLIFIIS